MSMTGDGMRDAVFDALFIAGVYGSMTEDELALVKANMLIAENARVVYIQENAVVKVTIDSGDDANTRINTVIGAGVPFGGDGGAALKSTQLVVAAVPSIEKSTGDPDEGNGGIT